MLVNEAVQLKNVEIGDADEGGRARVHCIIAHIVPMIEINFESISRFINLPCQNNKIDSLMKRKLSTECNQSNIILPTIFRFSMCMQCTT